MVPPQDSYLTYGPYLELMTGIRTALQINEGIIKVVGAEGSGKSAFCRELARSLRSNGQTVIFFETPPESVDFLHKRIQSELDLPADKNFTRSLTNYLLSRQAPNNKLFLIYDDAEKISKEIFILIRLLNNIHDASETLVSQVICGTEKLDKVFDDPELRSLTQYLNQSFVLPAMSHDQLVDFCAAYMKRTSVPTGTMTGKDITDIYLVGKGMPGKTLELLDSHVQRYQASIASDSAQPGAPEEAVTDHVSATPRPAEPQRLDADKILRREPLPRNRREALFFKSVVAMIILISSVILIVVLSDRREQAPDRIAEILAADSPLYLDEIDDVAEPVAADTTTDAADETGTDDSSTGNVASDTTTSLLIAGSTEAEESTADIGQPEQEVPDASAAVTESAVIESAVTVTDSAIMPTAESVVPETDTAPELAGTNTPALPQTDPAPEAPAAPGVSSVIAANDTFEDTDIVVAEDNASADEPIAEDVVEVASAPDVSGELQSLIQRWLDAWQEGDFQDYLAAYHADFAPAYHDTRALWESEREARIEGVTGIRVGFDRFSIEAETDDTVTARFWLAYARGNYADDTLKEIVFMRDNGQWFIFSERNLELIVH